MVTKTYKSPIALTEDTWKYSNKEQKLKLLEAIGSDKSWAETKTIQEMVKRGGGFTARALKNLSQEQLRRSGGSITINWR